MADRPRTTASSLSTNPQDASGYRSGAKNGKRRTGGPRSGGESGGGGRMIGVNIIMAILVAGLMVAGWFIANQDQQLDASDAKLADADARLLVLEDRLRVTDEAMTESGQDTEQKIGFWESEIRKLWAVTNERNKKWIQDNQKDVERVSKTLAAIEQEQRKVSSAVGRHESAFEQQQEVVDQLTKVQLQLQRVENSQRDLVDQVNATSLSVRSLKADLAGRVSENTEAVKAIDAYRLQLNSRLASIEERLRGVSGPNF